MNQVTLKVAGMSCGHCVNTIEGTLQSLGASGKVDLSGGTVDVTYNGGELSLQAIKAAIEDQGYEVV